LLKSVRIPHLSVFARKIVRIIELKEKLNRTRRRTIRAATPMPWFGANCSKPGFKPEFRMSGSRLGVTSPSPGLAAVCKCGRIQRNAWA
jgi:hypothetical protein